MFFGQFNNNQASLANQGKPLFQEKHHEAIETIDAMVGAMVADPGRTGCNCGDFCFCHNHR